MGMKKQTAYLGMMGMAMALMNEEGIVERGEVATSKPRKSTPIKELTPFKEQEGIKKMISEYILIKNGDSKKGQLKQNRITEKIESYLEKGILSNEDLTNPQHNQRD